MTEDLTQKISAASAELERLSAPDSKATVGQVRDAAKTVRRLVDRRYEISKAERIEQVVTWAMQTLKINRHDAHLVAQAAMPSRLDFDSHETLKMLRRIDEPLTGDEDLVAAVNAQWMARLRLYELEQKVNDINRREQALFNDRGAAWSEYLKVEKEHSAMAEELNGLRMAAKMSNYALAVVGAMHPSTTPAALAWIAEGLWQCGTDLALSAEVIVEQSRQARTVNAVLRAVHGPIPTDH